MSAIDVPTKVGSDDAVVLTEILGATVTDVVGGARRNLCFERKERGGKDVKRGP